MAGTTGVVTVTEQTVTSIRLIKFDWVVGSSSQTGTAVGYTSEVGYSGEVMEFVTVPSTTAIPTDNYDITVTDKNGIDLLCGSASNRDTAVMEYLVKATTAVDRWYNPLGFVCGSSLVFTVTNAGTESAGVAYLYLR
jgi:1-aminocyclopropane-1-carboxylate deaminase/D-cysteine desulfhydrase-like pyridoxal-dependent ACC family enzyme